MFLSWLAQTFAVTALNLRNLKERLDSSLVSMIGVAGVVMVFVAVLSIAEGFRATLTGTADPETVVVLRSGAQSELTSVLRREETRIVKEAPGIRRSARGPLASAELLVVADVAKRSNGSEANVPFRGVEPAAFELRPRVRIVAGRSFRSGAKEIIVGRAAAAEFAGLDLGAVLRWGANEWTVVGLFAADGAVYESEVWTDVNVLQPAYQRGESFQSVSVKLASPDAYQVFADALGTDPRVQVKAVRETDYYAEQSRLLYQIISGLGGAIAGLMSIGAVFGALNTMYSAVSARTREIATLRALGFPGGAVVVSVVVESLCLALVGGALGGAVAFALFNGTQAATINWQSFSQVAFAFAVTPALLVRGLMFALGVGLLGGIFPAVRAFRMPIATALREI